MSDRHIFNGGLISTSRASLSQQSGVWSIGNAPSSTFSYTAPVFTIDTSEIGYSPVPDTQAGGEYIYNTRNVKLFYEDAYGSAAHVSAGTSSGSYIDVRQMTKDDGRVDASSFLVSNANKKTGWYYDDFISVKGFEFYGKYSSANSENQGTYTIWGYDGNSWTTIETFAPATFTGISSSGTPILFTGGAQSLKGIAISTSTIYIYMPINWFVGIFNDSNNYPIQGYTIS